MISPMPKNTSAQMVVPSSHNWRTTDQDEINRRRQRARTEEFRISNMDARHPVFSNFRVRSGSGLTYSVEIRDVRQREFACDCVDSRINGLGTCKHVEATTAPGGAFKTPFAAAAANESPHRRRARLGKRFAANLAAQTAIPGGVQSGSPLRTNRWPAASENNPRPFGNPRPDCLPSACPQEQSPWLQARRWRSSANCSGMNTN